jgi:hypothetical protein
MIHNIEQKPFSLYPLLYYGEEVIFLQEKMDKVQSIENMQRYILEFHVPED